MIPLRYEIRRSLELFIVQKEMQEQAEKNVHHLVLTYSPRDASSIKNVVVAFGSYDPLTLAHEMLFAAAKEAVQRNYFEDTGEVKALEATASEATALKATSVLVVSSTAHYDKRVDLQQNSALPDRILALETRYAQRSQNFVGLFNNPYFVHLAPKVQEVFPQANLSFVMGTDVLEKIADCAAQRKHGFDPRQVYETIFQHDFLVSARSYNFQGQKQLVTRDMLVEANVHLLPFEKKIRHLAVPEKSNASDLLFSGMSSTTVREKVNNGESLDDLVHLFVKNFISDWKLYQHNNSWYEASVALREWLVKSRNGDMQKIIKNINFFI